MGRWHGSGFGQALAPSDFRAQIAVMRGCADQRAQHTIARNAPNRLATGARAGAAQAGAHAGLAGHRVPQSWACGFWACALPQACDDAAPQATSHKPQATSHKPQATSQKPKAKSQKPKAKSQKPRGTWHDGPRPKPAQACWRCTSIFRCVGEARKSFAFALLPRTSSNVERNVGLNRIDRARAGGLYAFVADDRLGGKPKPKTKTKPVPVPVPVTRPNRLRACRAAAAQYLVQMNQRRPFHAPCRQMVASEMVQGSAAFASAK